MRNTKDLPAGRLYEVISVYERRNAAPRTEVQCPGPFTHREACTVVRKFNPSKYVRILIRELDCRGAGVECPCSRDHGDSHDRGEQPHAL